MLQNPFCKQCVQKWISLGFKTYMVMDCVYLKFWSLHGETCSKFSMATNESSENHRYSFRERNHMKISFFFKCTEKKMHLVNLPWNCPLFPAVLKSLTKETSLGTSESSSNDSKCFSPSTTLTWHEDKHISKIEINYKWKFSIKRFNILSNKTKSKISTKVFSRILPPFRQPSQCQKKCLEPEQDSASHFDFVL